jgi:hypothetical protein
MALRSIAHTAPRGQTPTTDIQSRIIEIETHAVVFRYEIARITPQCWTITALHTGAVRQYRQPEALWAFVANLRGHLVAQYGCPDYPLSAA